MEGATLKSYETLDAILVIGVLMILAASIGVMLLQPVPQANLPIVSGLISGLVSAVVAGYAAYRWGASQERARLHTAPGAASIALDAQVSTAPGAADVK